MTTEQMVKALIEAKKATDKNSAELNKIAAELRKKHSK